ncbi:hypothetical protein [Frigoriglobus tundricola]|uniref:Carboxypeptidase regulatory-like domain-containing protein n=1 Tax=Frigoriglobus tundricola TaxID=2774151 RepID=A0A6M5YY43_9BACT|nr:hypothetical protein [Frigoriglobus tundricola]QJW98939.1 hypothetical protein FTUN_6534 [Frigoriglobus tundricola]
MRSIRVITSKSGPVLLAALLSGCGLGNTGATPTRGQVHTGSAPAEGVQVTLVPIDGKDEPASRPSGVVGADGTFTLSTYDPATRKSHEGAPPGKYAVLVTWYPPAGLGSSRDGTPRADRLGGRYKDAATSPFRVEVTDAPTELAPIQVTEVGSTANAKSPFNRR